MEEEELSFGERFTRLPGPIKSLFVGLVLLSGVAVVVAPISGYFSYKSWSISKALREGEAALNAGKPEKALEAYRVAFNWAPTTPAISRQYFTLLKQQDLEEAVAELGKRYEEGTASVVDRVDYAECLVALGQYAEAEQLIQSLDASHPGLALLQGEIALAKGDLSVAMPLLRQAYDSNPEDDATRLIWATALAQSPHALDRVAAKVKLKELVVTAHYKHQVEALRVLLETPFMPLFSEELSALSIELSDLLATEGADFGWKTRQLSQVARRIVAVNPECAHLLLSKVIGRSDVEETDLLLFAQIAQKRKDLALAGKTLAGIKNSSDPEYLLLSAQQKCLSQNFDSGLPELSRACALPQIRSRAYRFIRSQLSDLNSGLNLSEQKSMLQIILDETGFEAQEKLPLYGHWFELEPESALKIAQDAVQLLDEEYRAPIAYLLNQRGHHAVVLSFIDPAQAFKELALMGQRTEALLALGRISEFEANLKAIENNIPQVYYDYLWCQRYAVSGDFEKAEAYWLQAYQVAQQESLAPLLLSLAQIDLNDTESEDRVSLRLGAYRQAARQAAPFEKDDWLDYFKLSRKAGNPAESLSLAKRMSEQYPSDPDYQYYFIYLSLLTDFSEVDLNDRIQKIITDYPEKQEYRINVALHEYRNGEFRKAIKTFESIGVDLSAKGDPQLKTLYAYALAANGQKELAQSIAKHIDPLRLGQSERALLALISGADQDIVDL